MSNVMPDPPFARTGLRYRLSLLQHGWRRCMFATRTWTCVAALQRSGDFHYHIAFNSPLRSDMQRSVRAQVSVSASIMKGNYTAHLGAMLPPSCVIGYATSAGFTD